MRIFIQITIALIATLSSPLVVAQETSSLRFLVPFYGKPVTQCDDLRFGGRPGARTIACVNVGEGKNHSCELLSYGCIAWEEPGNEGQAACDAVCQSPSNN